MHKRLLQALAERETSFAMLQAFGSSGENALRVAHQRQELENVFHRHVGHTFIAFIFVILSSLVFFTENSILLFAGMITLTITSFVALVSSMKLICAWRACKFYRFYPGGL